MRYVDNDFALSLQLFNDCKETVDLRVAQAGRGLVKADNLQILTAVSLHNLHHLLIGNAQILYLCGGRNRKAEIINDFLRHLVRLRCADDPQFIRRHPSQINIFSYAQLQQNLPFLVDDADAFLDGLLW